MPTDDKAKTCDAGVLGMFLCNRFTWYIGFYLLCYTFKSVAKWLGALADKHKRGTFSVYLALDFVVSLQFFTQYRELLTQRVVEEDPLPVFIGLQLLHMATEWVTITLKGSQAYFNTAVGSDRARQIMLPPAARTHRDLQCLVAMEAAMQFMCAVFTAVFFIGTQYALVGSPRSSYLQKEFHPGWMADRLDLVPVYLFIALAADLLNLVLLETLYFRPRDLSMCFHGAFKLLQQRRFSLCCFGECTIVSINILYSMIMFDGIGLFGNHNSTVTNANVTLPFSTTVAC